MVRYLVKTDNRLKWATAAFSLLALMVLAYSGKKLTLLYDIPLVGVSIESKLAKQKWNQLEKLISEQAKKDWSESIGLFIESVPLKKKKVVKSISSQKIQQAVQYNKETLPEISGIIITWDTSQKSNAFVISQGNIYSENDEVSGYMIKKITEKGVTITKNGREYFIDAPKAPYSIDQGK
jgi:hypothetical protein